MAQRVIDTQHADVVHDAQFDYYGVLVATASSDRTVKIVDTTKEPSHVVATLYGHEGPVWMVAWAHPRFGRVLASCSFDKRVYVWKEHPAGQWKPVHAVSIHQGSMNAIAWAPHEYGPILGAASSDGTASLSQCLPQFGWKEPVKALHVGGVTHMMGVNCISFAPFHPSMSENVLFATGGCDSRVRVWRVPRDVTSSPCELLCELSEHKDWVRDVAFNPDGASTYITLASCGQDRTVIVRRIARSALAANKSATWETSVTSFPDAVWRLSWSPSGTELLATNGNSEGILLSPQPVFTDPWISVPLPDRQPAPTRQA